MIHITKPSECCGCTACANICNHGAITMQPDKLGFLYPEVDNVKCINCGLCEKVCAFNDNYDKSSNLPKPIAYGARHKDIDEVMRSRSGAVFVAISDYILENGGVVYGAGYIDHFRVVHKRATTKEERDEFRGSKYVQSDLNTIFKQIKKDLKDGLAVLFSGTGCQTAGLTSYIGKKLRCNLILVDLVCHGVPSPYLWRDYLTYLENEKRAKIQEVNFRDKSQFGWEAHKETFRFNGSENNVSVDTCFYKRIMLRPSCSECHFCNTSRPSDITIADFWGWNKQGIKINNDNKGLNLVLVNTNKGVEIFSAISHMLTLVDADDRYYLQPNLCHPTEPHPFRDLFQQDYLKKGFEYVFFHNYDAPSIKERLKRKWNLLKKR